MSDQPEITPKIKLNLTHSILHSRIPEVRFDLNEQIAEIKVRIILSSQLKYLREHVKRSLEQKTIPCNLFFKI